MKYFIRFIAVIPMMATMCTAAVLFMLSFTEGLWLVIPSICLLYAFIICGENYDKTVRHIAVFLKLMAEDALTE